MLKNQTVNHVSEHLSAICPVYTPNGGGLKLIVLASSPSTRIHRRCPIRTFIIRGNKKGKTYLPF